ncbi:hypothetical protein [Pseudomonas sp. PSKL.D1]|uniref:hypothetical protein n=1 Tax=Pseudomonas sp. PSKL.D1 TaxID=3029060 RepID=UPI002380DC83|nr:hypothetical protein [Pseudomonas sp. PSKL.D1]WDY56693.1 hypothetical protein PVV54_19190 [Pseudomonas sp. PSKL.D1]
MNGIHPGLIAGLIIVPMVIALIVQAYVAHKYTERFEALLANCAFVTGNKTTFQYAGLMGKVMRTGLISMVLAMPGVFMRRGLIDLDEVKRFPPRLKRLLVTQLVIHILLFAALIISHYAQPANI